MPAPVCAGWGREDNLEVRRNGRPGSGVYSTKETINQRADTHAPAKTDCEANQMQQRTRDMLVMTLAAAVLLGFCSTPAPAQFRLPATLKEGDPAPPLQVSDWVKGGPIKLADGKGKQVYVLEFWAVWCTPCIISIPHMTELQHKYKDDLVVVGITSMDPRNTLSQVRNFVDDQGAKMDYVVGFEREPATARAYLEAVGAMGIPHAFVVDREGRIVWQGNPLDTPTLDQVVADVIAGTFDLAKAQRTQEAGKLLQQAMMQLRMQRFEEVVQLMKEALKIDPAHEMALGLMHTVAREQLNDSAGLRAWCATHQREHADDVEVQYRLGRVLAESNDLTTRFPDLALTAARRAYELGGKQRFDTTALYARVLYLIGHLDEAIKLQQQALPLASESEQDGARKTLDYYELCRKLRDQYKPEE